MKANTVGEGTKGRIIDKTDTAVLWALYTTGTNQLRSGLDVVVEGTATRVTDETQLRRLAALWKSKLDWPFEVADGAFRDAAGRQGLVFGVKPRKILSFGKGEPFSQTRFRFTA